MRGIYEEGAIKNLIHEVKMYGRQIVALQESHETKNNLGTGLLVQ